MRKFTFPLITILVSFFLTAALLEIGLRLGGRYVETYSDRVVTFGTGEKIYRIIAMGESTTDGYWADHRDQSWPSQLGQKLAEKFPDYRFEIYNIAQGGTSSPFLIGKLQNTLVSVEPNLVLAMMGVNDYANFQYFHPTQIGWSSMRIVKMFKWLVNSLELRFNGNEIRAQQLVSQSLKEFADQVHSDVSIMVSNSSGDRAEVERITAEFLKKGSDPNYLSKLHLGIGIALFDKYNNIRVARGLVVGEMTDEIPLSYLRQSFDHVKKAHAADPLDPVTMRFIFYCGQHLALDDEAFEYFRRSISAGLRPDGSILTLIPHKMMKQSWVRDVLAKEGYQFSVKDSNWRNVTIKSHRQIADLMKKKNVPFVAVQYPTALRLALINLYSENPQVEEESVIKSFYGNYPKDLKPAKQYEHVHFVDNENFNDRVKENGYDYYFSDKFTFPYGGKFGHAKFAGHELIAANVARYIIAHWEKDFQPR